MKQVELRRNVFVPVAIDAERVIDGVDMVRVTYFALTTDAPADVWEVELPPLARLHGIGALGLAGVIYSAMREESGPGQDTIEFDLFSRAGDVAAIFALEQEGTPLSVQVEDVWMPRTWFTRVQVWDEPDPDPDQSVELARGHVFRVALPAFQEAYRYTAGDVSLDVLIERDVSDQIVSSPVETEAMMAWSQAQIDETRRAFPGKDVKLRYRGQDDG